MKSAQKSIFPLKLLGVAAVYWLLGWASLTFFAPDGYIGVFWPAAGWAMAVLLIGGRRYGWSIFAGAFVPNLMAGVPWPATVLLGVGGATGALAGHWLLSHDGKFDLSFKTVGDVFRLLLKGAVPASAISAIVGVSSMTAFGLLQVSSSDKNMLHWIIGDMLGILVVTPLISIWRSRSETLASKKRWLEIAVFAGLTLLLGQTVFLGWFADLLPWFPRKGYWLLPLALWGAARLGSRSVISMLCVITIQGMFGVHENVGLFANPQIESRLIDGSLFLVFACMFLMSMAIYLESLRRAETNLLIAATAFECQEAIIIADFNQKIVRTNKSFSRIMGYSSDEVEGKHTSFMHSDRHSGAFFDGIRAEVMREGHWMGEIWYRRKNGEVFPAEMTITAVRDEHNAVSHFVATQVDLTRQKQLEEQRLAEEISHRDALVREVHHRIKNNLQGIAGLLRQFGQEHPQTSEAINQVMSQIRSIAVLHGLQGQTSMNTIRLCELTSAIASDISSVWQTPIAVDIPALWTPGIIAEREAVPVALVLNELLVNAVKHGGKAHGHVSVTLRKGQNEEQIRVSIRNSGHLRSNLDRPTGHHAGLQLIDSLMPHHGASLSRDQLGDEVLTRLDLEPPVIHLERMTS